MIDHDTQQHLQRLAESLPERPVPVGRVVAAAERGRRKYLRRKRLAATATALAVVGGVGMAAALSTTGGRENTGNQMATDGVVETGRLSDAQLAAATRVLETYLAKNPARVESVWVRWDQGAVKQPNLGECTSGELLRINVFGSFPAIVTSGGPPSLQGGQVDDADPLAGVVTEMHLVADGQTEVLCQLSVTTGTHDPDPQFTQVPFDQKPLDPETGDGEAVGRKARVDKDPPGWAISKNEFGGMRLADEAYAPGQTLRIFWPNEQVRGIGYALDRWQDGGWTPAYFMRAATHESQPEVGPAWWPIGGTGAIFDIGIGGPGPDIAVLPDTATSGTYRLCTTNTRGPSCTTLKVGQAPR